MYVCDFCVRIHVTFVHEGLLGSETQLNQSQVVPQVISAARSLQHKFPMCYLSDSGAQDIHCIGVTSTPTGATHVYRGVHLLQQNFRKTDQGAAF